MICTCHTCDHAFWKYRSDWLYPGYCSWHCYELRPPVSLGPETLASIQFLIRVHLQFTHNEDGADAWHADCERCQELEAKLVVLQRLEVCFGGVTA